MLINRESPDSDSGPMWWAEFIDPLYEVFQADRYNLVAEAVFPTIGFKAEQGRAPELNRVEGVAFKFTFSNPDYWAAVARLNFMAQRLRSYIAVVAARPVSLRYILAGDRITRVGEFDQGFGLGFRQIPGVEPPFTSLDAAARAVRRISQKVRGVDSLFARIDEGSALDRALSHMGNAQWVVDDLDSYLHAWRAIDACFARELDALRDSDPVRHRGPDNPFGSEVYGRLKSGSAAPLEPESFAEKTRIGYTVYSHLGYDLTEDIDEFVAGRSALAHGDVTLTEFRLVEKKLPRLLAISYRVTCSALTRQVPEARDFVEVLTNESIPSARIEYEMDSEMTKRIHEAARLDYERTKGGRS